MYPHNTPPAAATLLAGALLVAHVDVRRIDRGN
jgi:hypothetical protein